VFRLHYVSLGRIQVVDISDAHPRIVLAKGLTSAYMETRLFATHHLGRLLQEFPQLTEWALQLMITQLYDTAMEVCDVAVMYLEEVCSDPENLEKVVQLRPTLEHLGDVGHPLFMR
jgi:rapamycin-insensitive companion of mTOR